MNATQGDVDGPALDQSAIVGVDDRFDHFVFEVAFLAAVGSYVQCIQQGRMPCAAHPTLSYPQGQMQFSKNRGYHAGVLAIASFSYAATVAETVVGVPLSDMASKAFPHFTRGHDAALRA